MRYEAVKGEMFSISGQGHASRAMPLPMLMSSTATRGLLSAEHVGALNALFPSSLLLGSAGLTRCYRHGHIGHLPWLATQLQY